MRKGVIAGIVAAAIAVPAVVVPLSVSNSPSPPPGGAQPSVGAPAPTSFSLGGSCPQVIGPATSQTTALTNWISSFPKGSSITFPHDACYITNGQFALKGLKQLSINGNGSTFTQTVPGLNGGSDTAECGPGQRFYLVASQNVTVSNLNFVGAWSADPGFDSTFTSTAGTQSFGSIILTGSGTNNGPGGGTTPISQIAVGDLVHGPGISHASGHLYYVTGVNSSTKTVTYAGTGTDVPQPSGAYVFQSNGGQHCESYAGANLEGDDHVTLTSLDFQNLQGDGIDIQLPTDGSIKGNPVNTNITISNSVYNAIGYDCISVESANGNTFVNNTFSNCSENNIDMEVDNADSGFDPTGLCTFACQSNVLFTRNIFNDNNGRFFTSPQGGCPGVQQQHVTFSANTIIDPHAGIFVTGTTQAGCQIPVTFAAQSVGHNGCGGHGPGGGNCPSIHTMHSPDGVTQNGVITGTGLVGFWTVYDVLPPSHTIIFEPGAGATGTPVTGGSYTFIGPASATKYLTIYLTLENNIIQIGHGSQFNGFNALNGSDANCGQPGHGACPAGFAMEFTGINQILMENNQFFINNSNGPPPTSSPYIAVIANHNVNGEVIKNNNFSGAYTLFNNNNSDSVGIVDCGNTWSHTPFNDGSC